MLPKKTQAQKKSARNWLAARAAVNRILLALNFAQKILTGTQTFFKLFFSQHLYFFDR